MAANKIKGTNGDDTITGTPGNDKIDAKKGNDTIFGSAGNDDLKGKDGNDTFDGGPGNDKIDGGKGIDTAIYHGSYADYVVTFSGHGNDQVTVAGKPSTAGAADGTDTLKNVEFLQFADARVEVSNGHVTPLYTANPGEVNVYDSSYHLVATYGTIHDAVEAASTQNGYTVAVGAGTYNEHVVVNKELTIAGVGEVTVHGTFKSDNGIAENGSVAQFLETAPSYTGMAGAAFSVTANNITLQNINIDSFLNGVQVDANISNLALNDVDVTDTVIGLVTSFTTGGPARNVDGLAIHGGSFSDGHIGIDFERGGSPTVGVGDVTHLSIDGTRFFDLTAKGIYFEGLSHALISGVSMDHVGYWGAEPTFGGNAAGTTGFGGAGIEINLKRGNYTDITITNFDLHNTGQSDHNGTVTANDNAAAISVKDRGDNGDNPNYAPVVFTGPVTISDGSIDGTSTGIRAGEAGRNLNGPEVNVSDVSIAGALHDLRNGDVENLTTQPMTVDLADDAHNLFISPQSRGVITVHAGDGSDQVTSGGGNETFVSGHGNDTFVFTTATMTNAIVETDTFQDYQAHHDAIDLPNAAADVFAYTEAPGEVTLTLVGDHDMVRVQGVSHFSDVTIV